MSLLAVANLTVSYPRDGRTVVALGGIGLDMAAGERVAVIGVCGSGTRPLARAVAGLLPPQAKVSGRIVWPALGAPPVPGKDFGYVFQDPSASLDPVMTIGEQVAEVVHAHLRLGWKACLRHAAELLDRVKLPDPTTLLTAYPHELSGGQKQRVAIAAAIAAKPKLLIADE
ncbi:ATP-binding cassette domain-containing protein, partial [Rhizobiaceae sp. 2RAB30]